MTQLAMRLLRAAKQESDEEIIDSHTHIHIYTYMCVCVHIYIHTHTLCHLLPGLLETALACGRWQSKKRWAVRKCTKCSTQSHLLIRMHWLKDGEQQESIHLWCKTSDLEELTQSGRRAGQNGCVMGLIMWEIKSEKSIWKENTLALIFDSTLGA